MKEDQTTVLDAPLESFHEVNDIGTHGIQIDSTRDASFQLSHVEDGNKSNNLV